MKQNEVVKILTELGFELQEMPEMGYVLEYEGLTLLYMPEDDDEDIVRFAVPNIFEVTEENRPFVLDVVNSTNLTIKYSKVCVYGDVVWAFYEYRGFGGEDGEKLIEHCLYLLYATVSLFHRKIEGEDGIVPEEENSDNNNNEEEWS